MISDSELDAIEITNDRRGLWSFEGKKLIEAVRELKKELERTEIKVVKRKPKIVFNIDEGEDNK